MGLSPFSKTYCQSRRMRTNNNNKVTKLHKKDKCTIVQTYKNNMRESIISVYYTNSSKKKKNSLSLVDAERIIYRIKYS